MYDAKRSGRDQVRVAAVQTVQRKRDRRVVAHEGRLQQGRLDDRAEQLPLTVQATKGRCGLGNQCPHEEIVAVTIAITKLSSANTVDVSHAVIETLPGLEESLQGASLAVIFDQAPYIEQSIETLAVEGLLGLVFAVFVILIFLQSWRATLIPTLAIPVVLLGTFAVLAFAGMSINTLTTVSYTHLTLPTIYSV